MATFTAVILKGKIHRRRDGKRNVKIRVTHKGKVAYISTDLYVTVFKNGQATGDNELYINESIRELLSDYTGKYIRIGRQRDKLTVQEIKARLTDENYAEEIDFIRFGENYVTGLKTGSKRGLNNFMSKLKKFKGQIFFSDIDLKFLYDFEMFMIETGVTDTTKYMRDFRLIFNLGRKMYNDEDRMIIKIPNYPFRSYKFKKRSDNSNKCSLTIEQLRYFINFEPVTDRQKLSKTVFMLSFFLMGINTIDMYKLSDLKNKGRVRYKRSKTGHQFSIAVEPEIISFIDEFTRLNVRGRYSNYLNFQKAVNTGLKGICKAINKKGVIFPDNVTSNWARHAWATIARNDCRIDKSNVALCLGHKDQSNRVTDIYIKYDYTLIDDANRRVIDLLFSSEKPVVNYYSQYSYN